MSGQLGSALMPYLSQLYQSRATPLTARQAPVRGQPNSLFSNSRYYKGSGISPASASSGITNRRGLPWRTNASGRSGTPPSWPQTWGSSNVGLPGGDWGSGGSVIDDLTPGSPNYNPAAAAQVRQTNARLLAARDYTKGDWSFLTNPSLPTYDASVAAEYARQQQSQQGGSPSGQRDLNVPFAPAVRQWNEATGQYGYNPGYGPAPGVGAMATPQPNGLRDVRPQNWPAVPGSGGGYLSAPSGEQNLQGFPPGYGTNPQPPYPAPAGYGWVEGAGPQGQSRPPTLQRFGAGTGITPSGSGPSQGIAPGRGGQQYDAMGQPARNAGGLPMTAQQLQALAQGGGQNAMVSASNPFGLPPSAMGGGRQQSGWLTHDRFGMPLVGPGTGPGYTEPINAEQIRANEFLARSPLGEGPVSVDNRGYLAGGQQPQSGGGYIAGTSWNGLGGQAPYGYDPWTVDLQGNPYRSPHQRTTAELQADTQFRLQNSPRGGGVPTQNPRTGQWTYDYTPRPPTMTEDPIYEAAMRGWGNAGFPAISDASGQSWQYTPGGPQSSDSWARVGQQATPQQGNWQGYPGYAGGQMPQQGGQPLRDWMAQAPASPDLSRGPGGFQPGLAYTPDTTFQVNPSSGMLEKWRRDPNTGALTEQIGSPWNPQQGATPQQGGQAQRGTSAWQNFDFGTAPDVYGQQWQYQPGTGGWIQVPEVSNAQNFVPSGSTQSSLFESPPRGPVAQQQQYNPWGSVQAPAVQPFTQTSSAYRGPVPPSMQAPQGGK